MCEQDGSTCAAPQHRYVFSFKLVDFSGEVWANVFSQEVRGGVDRGCRLDIATMQFMQPRVIHTSLCKSVHTHRHPQGEALLGCSASKLAEVKERDADAAAAAIKAAQWQVRGRSHAL